MIDENSHKENQCNDDDEGNNIPLVVFPQNVPERLQRIEDPQERGIWTADFERVQCNTVTNPLTMPAQCSFNALSLSLSFCLSVCQFHSLGAEAWNAGDP